MKGAREKNEQRQMLQVQRNQFLSQQKHRPTKMYVREADGVSHAQSFSRFHNKFSGLNEK